jgi:hypothetical protein
MRSKQERNQIITSEEKGRLRNHWRVPSVLFFYRSRRISERLHSRCSRRPPFFERNSDVREDNS